MLYLVDASVLITAKTGFYQFDRVPEFWDWLVFQGEQGRIKIPFEIYEEFRDTKDANGERDELAEWANKPVVKRALLLQSDLDVASVQTVIKDGYGITHVTDEDTDLMGRDPFLISYALIHQPCCVISAEVSKPTQTLAKSKMPDVCKKLNIKCSSLVELLNSLDFRTNFRQHLNNRT